MAKPIRILVTGSREWRDHQAIYEALLWLVTDSEYAGRPVTVVHGGARGADRIAAELARELGLRVEEHPADWDAYGKAAGHRRNAEMVALGADAALAFPIGPSLGTRGCIALCRKAGIPVSIHEGEPS